jgi:predicted glycosyltransferase
MSEIFFYVQNLLGIGHLRRAAVLAKAMAQAGLSVDFVTGGVPVPGLDPGPAKLVQLPPVRSADERFSALLDDRGVPIDEAWREGRRAALLEAFAASDPDALLIELYPFGRRAFRFELLPLIEAASARPHRPEILCSVRDILVEKGKPGRAEEAAALVERHFDAVLVHGDPAIAPFSASFPAADRIAGRLRYTGYVVEPRMPPEAPGPVPEGEVLLSAGGGAVGRPFVEAALAARPISKAKGLPWRVVLGPQYPEPEAARLVALSGPGLAIERFRPDLAQLFAGCSLSISQAGYNTVLELVAAGARAIVVPFSAGAESEQAARARLFAERGLLTVVEDGLLGPSAVARAIDAALARPRPAPGGGLRLDGARATAAFLLEAVARRRASRHDGAAPTGSGMGGQRRS